MAVPQNTFVVITRYARNEDERFLLDNAHLNARKVFVAPYRAELINPIFCEDGTPEFFRSLSIIQN